MECREDAAELIERNARRFALRNLSVVRGMAPEALEALPAPDSVFVGGSSGGMEQILRLALERNPRARIVVNAIALESVGELTRVAEALALEADIVQLTVARARKLGRYHLMNGMNPIWIAGLHRREGGTEHED